MTRSHLPTTLAVVALGVEGLVARVLEVHEDRPFLVSRDPQRLLYEVDPAPYEGHLPLTVWR